jgi:cytoskeletal protein RodZ
MTTPETLPTDAVEDAAPATVGARLRKLREQQDLSISQVSEETHISISNLKAIEQELFDQLPADTFTRGLVSIYGNFLGINGRETAKHFLQERDQNQPRRRRNRAVSRTHSLSPKKLAEPSHVSSATIAAFLLILIIATFSSFCVYTGWNPFAYFLQQNQPTVAPLSETIEQEPEENTTSSPPAAAVPAQDHQAVSKPYTLKAVFTRDTGVVVILDGQSPLHLQGNRGEQLQWQAGKSMQIRFEEPASADITLNDTSIAFPTIKEDGKLTLTIPDKLPRP